VVQRRYPAWWIGRYSLVVEPASRKAPVEATPEISMKSIVKAAFMGKMIDRPEMTDRTEMVKLPAKNKMMEVVMDVDEDREADRETKWEAVKTRIIIGAIEARITIGRVPRRGPVNGLIDDSTARRLLRDVPASIRLPARLTIQRLLLAVDRGGHAVLVTLWKPGNRRRREL
jgi:hypothetical protein